MAKTKISEYDSTANNNTDVASVNIDEGCAPSGINNAIRAVMAHLKDFQQGTNGDSFNGPHNGTVGATTPAAGTFTTLATTGNTTLGNDSGDVITINGSTSFGAGAGITGNLTLSSGTANGVAYLNGSKVLTTGSALQFDGNNLGLGSISNPVGASMTSLNVAGTTYATFYASANSAAVRGTFNATSADNTVNLRSLTNHPLVFGVNDNEVGRWTSTGLGIGTSSPGNKLTVSSPLTGTTPRSNSVLRVQSEATGRDVNIQLSDNVTYSAEVGMVSGNMYFATAGTERARIDSSGNFGIGTSSPGYTLEINKAGGGFRVRDASGGNDVVIQTAAGPISLIGSTGNTAIGFTTNNTERARIDSNGNVGIGTSSPSVRLQYSGAFDAGVAGRYPSAMGSGSYGGGIGFLDTAVSGLYTQDSGGSLMFFTGQTGSDTAASKVKMKIDSSGNLLVGTMTSYSARGVFDGGGSFDAIACYRPGTGYQGQIAFRNPNGPVGVISTSGTSTTYSTSSDYRLKNTIAPMTGALERNALLKPCTYSWVADGSSGEGFIAHELQSVFPNAVTGEKDAVDANGNPVYQGVDTSFLVGHLVACIQELKAELDALKAKIG